MLAPDWGPTRMKMRLPTPLHGWREFMGEVGVIILGVLIALGLGAIASEIGWKMETRQAGKSIGLELGEAIGQGLERVRVYGCVERRGDELAVAVTKASNDGRLPPIGDIGLPPRHTWNHGTWDSAMTSGTAAHFDREKLASYVAAYEYVTAFADTSAEESGNWSRLYSAVGPGRPLSSDEAGYLLRTISEARVANRRMARRAHLLDQLVRSYDIFVDETYMREYLERPPSAYPICHPINPGHPSNYGQAPEQLRPDALAKDAIRRIPLSK